MTIHGMRPPHLHKTANERNMQLTRAPLRHKTLSSGAPHAAEAHGEELKCRKSLLEDAIGHTEFGSDAYYAKH
eukprot:CAMPEP_0115487696 /NCGR_PEP_ID=MMETSP0271-20121206/61087_1 /TAXON_ID=71861 /ORGANISM="Scrippsiella trochoidea, Strain CCMP3099" /LENGTH=72 /DNA_ID=CAMNT_0002915751 /DNA_START=12 /DNA_END=231 /DNA_ORIENTATION=-